MIENIPNINDWGDHTSDRDMNYAFKIFSGKTNEEMIGEFRRNVTARTTDLKFMPDVPFRYYMMGFKNFIDKKLYDEFDCPDAVNCFITLVEEKLENSPEHIIPIMEEIKPTVELICNNQDSYGVDCSVYGDFKSKLEHISELQFRSLNGFP